MTDKSKKKFFSEFYDDHVSKLYRFVYLKVSSKETSQDLTSEVFLRFWEQLNSPTEIKNPRAFIYQIARNLVIDYYRKKEPQKIQPELIQIKDTKADLKQEVLLESDIKDIETALSKIPDEYQNMIIWYYLDEFSVSEIADITGKTENNVRVIIHRALSALRSILL